eukprot:COSAG05_NODE_10107_length_582_cov_4.869565_1_plen_81_part_00
MALVKNDTENEGEMAGEARFSREMTAARGLIGDPAQARRDSPDPGRRHDGRGHLAAILLPSAAGCARLQANQMHHRSTND